MPSRYDQLVSLVAEVKPRFIVEIGTHRGARAVAMCREALKHASEVQYVGYDVFETRDAAFHEQAMNGKGIALRTEAAAALDKVKAEHPGLHWRFVIGDTTETLHGTNVAADLVFVDGDHRLAAIRKDFEAVSWSGVVALDDYITPGPNGVLPDLALYGCNALADELGATLLPAKDPCRPGWFAQIAVVRR